MAPLLAEVEPGQVPGGGGEDAAGDTEGGHQEADTGSMVNKTFQFDVFLETYCLLLIASNLIPVMSQCMTRNMNETRHVTKIPWPCHVSWCPPASSGLRSALASTGETPDTRVVCCSLCVMCNV